MTLPSAASFSVRSLSGLRKSHHAAPIWPTPTTAKNALSATFTSTCSIVATMWIVPDVSARPDSARIGPGTRETTGTERCAGALSMS